MVELDKIELGNLLLQLKWTDLDWLERKCRELKVEALGDRFYTDMRATPQPSARIYYGTTEN